MSIASLKETLESEKETIKTALNEMEAENVHETAVKNLLNKLETDISSFVNKIKADFETGLKEYDMVKYLNNMLKLEYKGIFDYNYYASRVEDKELAGKLKSFGAMEIEHAHLMIDKIKALGTKPKIPGAASRGKYANVLEMLNEHAAAEREAIRLCEEGVKVFTDPEFQWILGAIRVDEMEHQKEIKELIKRFENVEMSFTIRTKYSPPKDIDFESDEPWTE
jgi:bacterioferritin (cytochrome b1)